MDRAILTLSLLSLACNLDAPFTRATEYSAGWSATETPTTSTSTSGDVPTTGSDPGVFSVTGDLSTGSGAATESTATDSAATDSAATDSAATDSATTDDADPAHLISFTVTPNPVEAVGPVALEVVAAGEIDEVTLEVDGELLAVGPGPSLEGVYEALSSLGNGPHTAVARVSGAGGVDELEVVLMQAVPDGGAPVWTAAKVPDGETTMGVRVAVYGDYTFVVGTELVAATPRMLVRCYVGPKQCWSATLDEWTDLAIGKAAPSGGVDIEVDKDGLVVAGNLMIDGLPRRYHARLTFAGEVIDESLGNLHEFAGGLALGANGEIVLAGGVFTNPDASDTDLAWWSFAADGLPIASPVWSGDAGTLNEVGTDAAIELATGRLFVAGRRDVLDANQISHRRQLVLKYTLPGLLLGTWTSPGGYGEEEASAIADAPEGPCITGSATMGGTRHALTRCLSSDLALERWHHWDPDESAGFGVDHHRAGLIIVAGAWTSKKDGPRAGVAALQDGGEPLWFYGFPNPDGKVDEARGVRCDSWGRCRWTGWQSAGGTYLVVGELTP